MLNQFKVVVLILYGPCPQIQYHKNRAACSLNSLCVQVCGADALTYKERQEEAVEEKEKPKDVEIGLKSLVDKYGMQKVLDTVARMSKKG